MLPMIGHEIQTIEYIKHDSDQWNLETRAWSTAAIVTVSQNNSHAFTLKL